MHAPYAAMTPGAPTRAGRYAVLGFPCRAAPPCASHALLPAPLPPPAVVWIVAHGKKLSKPKIMAVDVSKTCEGILHPDVPLSLRLSGILAGGVVKIYGRQVEYLFADSLHAAKTIAAHHEKATLVHDPCDPTRRITIDADGQDLHFLLDRPEDAPPAGNRRRKEITMDDLFVAPSLHPHLTPAALLPEDELMEILDVPEPEASGDPHGAMAAPFVRSSDRGASSALRAHLDQHQEFEHHEIDMPDIGDLLGMNLAPGPGARGPGESPDPHAPCTGGAEPGFQDGACAPHMSPPPISECGPLPPPGGEPWPEEEPPAKKRRLHRLASDGEETTIRGRDYRMWTQDASATLTVRPLLGSGPGALTRDGGRVPDLARPEASSLLGAIFGQGVLLGTPFSGLYPQVPLLKRGKKAPAAPARPPGTPSPPGSSPGDAGQLPQHSHGPDVLGADDHPPAYDDFGVDYGEEQVFGHHASGLGGWGPAGRATGVSSAPMDASPSLRASLDPGEEVEVERLRAVLNTPARRGGVEDIAMVLRAGVSSGRVSGSTRNPSASHNSAVSDAHQEDLGLLPAEGYLGPVVPGAGESSGRGGSSSGARPSRSLPGSLPQLPEDIEVQPTAEIHVQLSDTTIGTVNLLRARIQELEDEGHTEAELSAQTMCRALKKSEAARFFMQLCVCKSTGLLKVSQASPYGNIVITRGPYLA